MNPLVTHSEPLLIMGCGAMAGLFASRLAAAGFNVILYDPWIEGIDAITQEGLRLIDNLRSESVLHVGATHLIEEVPPVKLALVLVKSWQTPTAAETLKKTLAKSGVAVTLQNGLGNYDILANALGKERVLVGVTTLGAALLEPGLVRFSGEGEVFLGPHLQVDAITSLFREANLETSPSPDIDSLIWGKLIINAAVNPLSALLDVKNGFILQDPSLMKLVDLTAHEGIAVASALDIVLPFADTIQQVHLVLKNTSGNYTSMVQDIRRHAPTEIDFINGAIVRYATLSGIPVPINMTLWTMVKGLVASFTR